MNNIFSGANDYRILLRNSAYKKDINILLNIIESNHIFNTSSIVYNASQNRIEIRLKKNSIKQHESVYYNKIGMAFSLFINNETVEKDFYDWANTQSNPAQLIEMYGKLKNFNMHLLYDSMHVLSGIVYIYL